MKNKIKRLLSFSAYYLKLVIAWLFLHTIYRDLLSRNIWLIREKRDEARDNGYHFFKFLREKNPEINAYFVITWDSPDRNKVEKYDNLIEADSWEHCIYFLAARFSINSQQYGAYPFHFSRRMLNYVQKLCNPKQKVIFLQHGITKDKFPILDFHYKSCNIDYFVTSTKKEYDFIKKTYEYPDNAIGCIGLARFDFLHTTHTVKKQLLVMPTWRRWLDNGNISYSLSDPMHFCNSDYFSAYAKMLSDDTLIQKLRSRGYQLVFYPHYKMQPFVERFRVFQNDVVVIADKSAFDVQELLMSSCMMVTDYSSVFFDFAYMNKPVAYYQFDKDAFRNTHYAEGYFSYENDAFGPCFENYERLCQYIVQMIDEHCRQPAMYDQRVKEFFTLRDNHNCERTYEAIRALEE